MDSLFKQTLRSEMDFQNIHVKELAAKTSISPRTLEGYVGARGSIPPADVAVKIADALNVSVEYLVTGKNTKKNQFEKTVLESREATENLSIGKRTLLKEFVKLLGKFDVRKK